MDKRQTAHRRTLNRWPASPPTETVVADAASPPLVARRLSKQSGHRIEPHWHARAQFLFAVAGTMAVRTPRRAWIVPTSRGLWIPAHTVHEIDMHGQVEMRTVYLDRALSEGMWPDCVVLEVTPLLRELLVRVAETSHERSGGDALLQPLLVAEIRRLTPARLDLPLPASPDLASLCERTIADFSVWRRNSEDAGEMSLSARTLYRLFLKETGISFSRWKQQARLLEAVKRLSSGAAVTEVALDLGYQSPGAFSTMFRRMLGETPSAYSRK
jgi:AraC-like DNA-binding protein/quercetin dioxygenase-like cupin family protein